MTEIEEAYYIKWALQFPDAPSGCSELLIAKAIEGVKGDNVKEITFGPGAADQIAAAAQTNGIKIWTLEHIYGALNKMFKVPFILASFTMSPLRFYTSCRTRQISAGNLVLRSVRYMSVTLRGSLV